METLVAAMARRCAGTAVELSVITLSGREGRVGTGVRALVDQFHVVPPASPVSMLLPLRLAHRIRQTRADLVHLHSGAWFKGAYAARLAGVRGVVYTEHGREHHDPTMQRWLDRTASRWTDVVVAVSGRLAAYLERRVGVAPRRIVVVENGVDTAGFAPGPAPASLRGCLGIPPEAAVIGSVGRLERVKRYDHLIEIVARLAHSGTLGRPVHLVLAGEGADRPVLERLAAQRGVADRVHLCGWSNAPADIYRLLDVFVLPSDSEGASVSLMEAMACGTPPVVTDVGASAQLVGPELAAHVVPAGDVSGLQAAITRALTTADARAAVGRVVRQRALARYGLDRLIAEYITIYHRAHGSPPRAAEAGATGSHGTSLAETGVETRMAGDQVGPEQLERGATECRM